MKKIILPFVLILFFSCKKDKISPIGPAPVTTVELKFDNDSNSSLMFKDGESMELLTSESRRYEIGKVLRVKAVNATTIEVANFAPVDIVDATILLTIEGQPKPIKLFKIGKIRAHAVQEIKYPFIEGDTKFLNSEDQEVDLAQYKTTGIPVNKVSFDFTGNTDLIKSLKLLAKLKWKIKYHDFDGNDDPNNNWKENIDAKDVRRFTGLIINLAYLFQSDATKTQFVAEPITDNNKVLLTTEQKEADFKKIIDMSTINCGVVVNVSGLGGGSTFGLANHVLRDYLTMDICSIAVHEIGHMIGYSHDSSMTYTTNNRGAVVATGNVYKDMLAKKQFPIKTSSYYKPTDL
ncbi:hypothetical protein [Pedobacter nyackensis]|uniref:Metallo-peptidase family M12B Reprolysin-like n=1 Tax=Pedobacter nyackensis TaxID=475255 RepID=A0A1W2F510_9SPHI|nr:hypothetical protein [Pedobacter nyackensis]SMD17009.1 hypothetical protein SAMN04488101_12145 [Pedobacter nyackensis]